MILSSLFYFAITQYHFTDLDPLLTFFFITPLFVTRKELKKKRGRVANFFHVTNKQNKNSKNDGVHNGLKI